MVTVWDFLLEDRTISASFVAELVRTHFVQASPEAGGVDCQLEPQSIGVRHCFHFDDMAIWTYQEEFVRLGGAAEPVNHTRVLISNVSWGLYFLDA